MTLKLALFAIFFVLASANQGLVLREKMNPVDTYQCFARSFYTLLATPVWTQGDGPNSYFTRGINYARTARIYNHDAIIRTGDISDPETICKETVNVLPGDFNGTVWVNLGFEFTSPVEDRMNYLDSLVRSCQQHGLKLGIFSDFSTWESVFGDRYASSSVVEALPLFYSNKDRWDNFKDYESVAFGKWSAPTMKSSYGTEFILCSRMTEHIYYP